MSRFENPIPRFEFRGVKSLGKLHTVFAGLKDQKTETCGPYSLLKLLRSIDGPRSRDLSEDYIAQLSGTLISEDERQVSQANQGAKESELEESVRQMYYPLELGISNSEEELGTSAEGLYHAMEKTLGNDFSLLSMASRAEGKIQFTTDFFSILTSTLWRQLPTVGLQAILNCQMSRLCSNKGLVSFMDVIEFLAEGGREEDDDWNVGHFMVLAGMFSVETSEGSKRFYLMQDSYKSKGMQGYRIQPEERVRSSLVRDDGRGGGIMFAIPRGDFDQFKADLGLHFVSGIWNNGTPFIAQGKH